MPAPPSVPAVAVEALVVEKALALVRELKKSCQAAPAGQVLAQAEQVALGQGRELIRTALEAVVGQLVVRPRRGPAGGVLRPAGHG